MRKYDKKNKRYFMMVMVLSLILIVIFSFFLNKVIANSKLNYEIAAGSIMYDSDKNLLRIDEDGNLKKKWNDTYYLTYKEDMINLGRNAIIYNPSKNQMNLYGRYYEISKNHKDKVIIHDEETLVNVTESKFYKIADRKYLLIDKSIKSKNNEINAQNYLIVELDTQGNALIYNNALNLKTFKETELITSTYTFNIAEEKLIIGDEEIDLKKIIGSTNKYVKAEDIEKKEEKEAKENNTNNDNNTANNTINNNTNTTNTTTTNNNKTNTNNDNNTTQNNDIDDNNTTNDNNNPENETIDNIIKATKTTSIISVKAGVGHINVEYVVYDPLDEYESIFVEIYDNNNNLSGVSYFDKTANSLVIPGLRANEIYNLVFKYSYYDNKRRIENEFDRASVMMSSPNISLKINKVTSNKIYYTVYLDSDYTLDSFKVNLTSGNTQKYNTVTNPNKNVIEGYFEYEELDRTVTVYLSDVIYKGYAINTNVSNRIVMP